MIGFIFKFIAGVLGFILKVILSFIGLVLFDKKYK